MCVDQLDGDRLHNRFEIWIDEVSSRRQHRYLTLVADHILEQIVCGPEGNDKAAADRFFKELSKPRSSTHRKRSRRSIRIPSWRSPLGARRDPLRLVERASSARRPRLRPADSRTRAGPPLKAPENLTDKQATTLRRLKRAGGEVWRANTHKEVRRPIIVPALP